MYILFINSYGKCDIFFSTQFNNNSNIKNCPIRGFNPTQPNPTQPMWIGLDWTYVMGWVGLNFFWPTMVGWVKKFPQPDPCILLLKVKVEQLVLNIPKREGKNYPRWDLLIAAGSSPFLSCKIRLQALPSCSFPNTQF